MVCVASFRVATASAADASSCDAAATGVMSLKTLVAAVLTSGVSAVISLKHNSLM